MMKLALMGTATGREDPELALQQRVKKHQQWTLDWWKSVLWSTASKFEIFGSNCRVFVRRRVGERMISPCLVPTLKHGGRGVMVLC